MVIITSERNLSLDNVINLYTSGEKELYADYERLRTSILNSDYLFTIFQDDELIGIIRSNGDSDNNQYISEIVLHGQHRTPGLGSMLLEAYLKATENVNKIYILSHEYFRSTFSKTWLQYKGFKVITENDNVIVYLLDREINY